MNEAWLFVLMTYFLLSVYFDTRHWQLGKFLGNILGLTFGSVGRMFSFFPDAQAWLEEAEREMARRGLLLHKVGHGWTGEVLG